MKIVQMDLKHGVMSVAANSLDDLWTLYNIINKGDLVYASTSREVKMNDAARPSSRRVSTSLWLRVGKVYFDGAVNRLRVHGMVEDAPEKLHVAGSHHTLSLELGDKVTIKKNQWRDYEVRKLKEASSEQQPLLVVSIDSEECCVALLRTYGVDVKVDLESRLPGKLEYEKREEAMRRFFSSICSALQTLREKGRYKIVIVGPGFTKENFMKFLKNCDDIAADVVGVKSASAGGIGGVYESMRSGAIVQVAKQARALKELSLVDQVFQRLAESRGDVGFGLEEVVKDISCGAVETLLILDEVLRDLDEDKRVMIDEALRSVEEKKGKIVVVSSEHEGGRKLESIGGIAALLRFQRRFQIKT